MQTFPMQYRSLFIDPSLYSPYYDASLMAALGAIDPSVLWLGSCDVRQLLPQPGGHPHEFYYRLTNAVFGARRPAVRGVCKTAEHVTDSLRLIPWAKARGVTVLHFQWSVLPWFDALVWRLYRRMGFRVLFTAHNLLPHDDVTRRTRARYRKLYASADAVIVHAQRTAAELQRDFGVPVQRIRVISHPYLKIDAAQPSPWSLAQLRRDYGVAERAPLVLAFGAIEPYKGFDLAIEMFAAVRARLPDAVLVVAGPARPAIAQSLSGRIAALGVQGSVITRLRWLADDEMKTLMALAAVAVMPYRAISQSAALLTAQAEGLPAVAFDVGGFAEVIGDGQTGFVVPAGDLAAMADRVCEILRDPALRQRMSVAAAERAIAQFSPAAAARRTAELYQLLRNNR